MPTVVSTYTGDETVVFAISASQYCHKVLNALDHLKLPHKVVLVKLTGLKTDLEPPHTVPQIRWKGTLYTDSGEFVEKLGEDYPPVYPKEHAATIKDIDTFTGRYNAYPLYFGLWVDEGLVLSYLPHIVSELGLGYLPNFLTSNILKLALSGARKEKRQVARKMLNNGVISESNGYDKKEIAALEETLIADTRKLDAYFQSDYQQWVVAGTSEPTAADFQMRGILEKMIGTNGDSGVIGCTPWLWEKAKAPRLQQWFDRMVSQLPLVYHGKFKDYQAKTIGS